MDLAFTFFDICQYPVHPWVICYGPSTKFFAFLSRYSRWFVHGLWCRWAQPTPVQCKLVSDCGNQDFIGSERGKNSMRPPGEESAPQGVGFLAWPFHHRSSWFTFRAKLFKDIPFLGQCFFQFVHAIQHSLQKLCLFCPYVAEISVSYACSDSIVIMVLSFNTTLLNQMCQNSCHRSKFLLNLWGC